MKANDKIIAAFLVSVGLFSTVQAKQYVSTLSADEKNAILPVANAQNDRLQLCGGVTDLAAVKPEE